MLKILRSMFASPEAQRDPHVWSSVFGAHAWIALGPWGLVAMYADKTVATFVVPACYFLLWELPQFALASERSRKLLADCVLDAVAVTFACVAAYYLAFDNMMAAIAAWGASVGVMGAGWRARE